MNLFSLSNMKITAVIFFLAGLGTAVAGLIYPSMTIMAAGFVFLVVGIQKAQTKMSNTAKVCKDLSMGQFESRFVLIEGDDEIAKLQWTINDMADRVDAFLREATASMEAISRNEYCRRILESGLSGSMLVGARVINKASDQVEQK